ncbi:MAG: hypothetical protein BWY93_00237 [Euryarchaeota archaeon ADurb.BinA087]|nr:MAG: hypothetical protein BWY93_00237 [Euryarchaeota archaeon ADurb.BinA087]
MKAPKIRVVTFIVHRSVSLLIGKAGFVPCIPWSVYPMTQIPSQKLAKVKYHRIYADEKGGSHFATNIIEQSSVQAAPPAAPFYVSGDHPATKYRFYTFEPDWIGEWHPAPTRQFLALMSGTVEMETTDGEVRHFAPGDLVLLEDTTGRGHMTRNIGRVYAIYFVVPAP